MKVLSIDVSASSLRVLKVCHDEACFHYETIYRVPNDMVFEDGHYHWDNEKILKGIQEGIVKACQEDPEIQSVGIDTWGVDYVPLDENGNLPKTKPASMAIESTLNQQRKYLRCHMKPASFFLHVFFHQTSYVGV